MIELVIGGKPEGKGRPRFGAGGRVYTPKVTEVAEREIRGKWEDIGKPRLPDDAAIELQLDVVVARPQGHFRKNGELSKEGLRHPVPRNKKPDLDNALKLVMDALNSRAYRDDVQIARVIVRRSWGTWPETRIRLKELHGSESEEV